MNKYIFHKQRDQENGFDNSDVKFEVETYDLKVLLEEFALFLNACGFTYVKNLDYESEKFEDEERVNKKKELTKHLTRKLHNDLKEHMEQKDNDKTDN